MLPLLQNIEAITSCRDRGKLPRTLMRAVVSLLGEQADVGIFSREPQGDLSLRVFSGPSIMESAVSLWPEFLDQVRSDGKLVLHDAHGRHCGAVMLQASELGGEQMILAFDLAPGDAEDHAEQIRTLARIYGNQLKLLDYSELDTLTRLLNRKTFDETFERLIAAAELAEQAAESLDPAGVLRLRLEAAEDRGQQRLGALRGDRGRHAELVRHRFDAAGLRQDIGQIHASFSHCGRGWNRPDARPL